MFKRTAVLTTSMNSFKSWCRERNIRHLKTGLFVDEDLENYFPIIRKEQLHGERFHEYEIDESQGNIEDLEELISLTRQRIY